MSLSLFTGIKFNPIKGLRKAAQTVVWILQTGTWNDAGRWNDASTWT